MGGYYVICFEVGVFFYLPTVKVRMRTQICRNTEWLKTFIIKGKNVLLAIAFTPDTFRERGALDVSLSIDT